MPIDVIMPKMGMGMSEGKLSRWQVKDGDSVEAGQVVLEVETDKATAEMTADVDGVISVVVAEGEVVDVGTVLGRIEPAEGAVVKPRAPGAAEGPSAEILQANGIALNVQRTGEGPAVVFIHGLSSSMELWTGLDQAGFQGRTLISYDLRGHGRSEQTPGAHTPPQAHRRPGGAAGNPRGRASQPGGPLAGRHDSGGAGRQPAR